jgi:hypothetical protein
MTDYVLFQMWGPFRQSLIAGHQFYVEQARKRLLSQFEDMETEADRAAEDWLQQSSSRFDPDRHDPGDFYEAANDAGIEFYTLLSEMRDQTRLSVVAGMFHEWEKQLRDWLVREIQGWHHGDAAATKLWSADFPQIAELLESLGWPISNAAYFQSLDACRLVVNVYKHGNGKSLEDLRAKHPEFLHDPFSGVGGGFLGVKYRDHTYLKVSDAQFQAFSDAIVSFWQEVPENIFASKVQHVPDWLGKAILKDRTGQNRLAKNER